MPSKPVPRRKRPTKPSAHLRTAAEAKAWLESNGISQAEFARRHGLPRMAVVDTLRGRSRGLRGDHHTAAIALGMKAAPEEPAHAVASVRGR